MYRLVRFAEDEGLKLKLHVARSSDSLRSKFEQLLQEAAAAPEEDASGAAGP